MIHAWRAGGGYPRADQTLPVNGGGALRTVIARASSLLPAGCVVAASNRPDFPNRTERFLFDFAVEQIGIALDASLTLEAERVAREAAEKAQAATQDALRARDAYLAIITHDLGSPLTTIKGYAQMLQRKPLPGSEAERIVEGLHSIEMAATKMQKQIWELLDVARLQSGQGLPLQRAPVDLITLTEGLVAQQRVQSQSHDIQFVTPEPELVGNWDVARLERVIANLLSNAVKYSPNGGEVLVQAIRRVTPAGAVAVLTVKDSGIGIHPDELPRLFEQFCRGSNVGDIQGTGVGLSSVRQIVEQHGGAITAESTPGHGSTFRLELPLPT
ncbi:MAG: HAMP domain-containing histidine kinase [Chloroflexi bacterium]|nr:HAMP domain-containing histidine kinase [Chloroflexota bacterium]